MKSSGRRFEFLFRPWRMNIMSDLAPLAEAVVIDPLVGHPADYHVFHKFLDRCKSLPAITTAVCWPLSDVALRGATEAAEEGLIKPTLIGDEAEMRALAAKIGVDISLVPHSRCRQRSQGRRAQRQHVPQRQCAGHDEGQPPHRRADEGRHGRAIPACALPAASPTYS